MSSNSGQLSFTEKVGYGLGDGASNFFFQTFNVFLLYYYTDIFGLSPAAVGTMFLITKLIDVITDPVMGIVADRTHTRWGNLDLIYFGWHYPMAFAATRCSRTLS
jgi:GPH family glycoside/pentoside/hexuronide:cation symporter